jgi:hypothetical protein
MIAAFPSINNSNNNNNNSNNNESGRGGRENEYENQKKCEKTRFENSSRCSTWVDDEIEQMPEELQKLMPRPDCCEKDENKQREASRLIKLLRGVDRIQLNCDQKSQFTLNNMFNIGEERFVTTTALDDDDDDKKRARGNNYDDDDEDSDFGNTDDDDGDDNNDEDPYLRELKAARIREMRSMAMKAEALQKQAEYVSMRERELLNVVKNNKRVLCHFTLDGVDECARIDEVFDELAKAFPKTKFIRIRPELGATSSVLQTCKISHPPAIVFFKNQRLSAWTNGFDQFGGRSGFSEENVTKYIAGIGALPGHPDAPRRNTKNSTTAARGQGADDDDYAEFDSEEDRERSDEDDEEVFGANEPCPDCGRTYPHKHIRALRPGGVDDSEENTNLSDDEI